MLSVLELITTVCTIIFLMVLYMKWSHTYWSRKNVPTTGRLYPILGNAENPLATKQGLMLRLKDCYDEFRLRKEKHGGIYLFLQPIYMPIDPELIKGILVKDFPHFLRHGIRFNEKLNPLGLNLFNLEGEKWRNMVVNT
ncbi:Cyp6a9 [Trypoxylus dichotomus]